ncbi:MAG: elongation factor P-like protein YeiP [Gammaproteobacteria bacterium]|nr:elongation factor P-like protein YeiP [Gammaproteobacteria bacterium]
MKACDLKWGMVVSLQGATYVVKELHVHSPSSRSGNTLYKVQYRDVVTKQKLDQTYKGDDTVETVDFMRRPAQLVYRETESCTFMDNESYEQHTIANTDLEAEMPYLVDGLQGIFLLVADDAVIGIELPGSIELEIVDTSPVIKGATAAARSKPATLITGLVVQVPEYIAPGERIRVNTQTGEFMSRA